MNLFNRLRFFVISVILLFLVCPNILSVSISPAKYKLNFEPNLEREFGFYICGAARISPYVEEDLAEYATIVDDNPDGGCRDITVKLKLPAMIEKPGMHRLLVGAMEIIDPTEGGVGGRAAIQAPIYIFVPYPGLYVEWSFAAPNVNEGETVDFRVSVSNLGTSDIKSARAIIDVHDENSKIKTLNTNEVSIASKKSIELPVDMSTTGMKAGAYKAIATLYYDGKTDSKEKTFNIGTLYVAINNHTKELEQEKINKFDIDVESRWNNMIKGIYGEVTINGITVKTPNYDLKPWEKKEIAAYYDTTGMRLGEYDAAITLFYEEKTTTEDGKVYIIEQIGKPSPEAEPKEEKPFRINIPITPTTLLIVLIVLLVVVDVVWLVMRARKRKKL